MSLASTVRSLTRNAKARFVGASDDNIKKFVILQVSVALEHPGRTVKDEELTPFIDAAFQSAVADGEEWAVALNNSYRDNVIKPLLDKAREKGVDPVPAIVMQTDLTEEQAREMVESLSLAEVEVEDDFDFQGDDTTVDSDADSNLAATA